MSFFSKKTADWIDIDNGTIRASSIDAIRLVKSGDRCCIELSVNGENLKLAPQNQSCELAKEAFLDLLKAVRGTVVKLS